SARRPCEYLTVKEVGLLMEIARDRGRYGHRDGAGSAMKGGVAAAHRQYSEQRRSDYSAYPRVYVWPKEDAKPPAGSPLASGDLIKGRYRLLLHNQDRLFLVRPFSSFRVSRCHWTR